MASFLSGAAFGAATVAAGVHQPSTIIAQLKFEDWHMAQTFLGATASSAIVYAIAERTGFIHLKPRSSSPVGLFGQYDGNVLGGLLLGAGMALSGSCPGTVLAQTGLGLQTGFFALGGALLGGILWTGPVSKAVKANKERTGVKEEISTLSHKLGLSRSATVLLFEAISISAIAATVAYGTGQSELTLFSAGAGLFIGAAQLFSLLSRRALLGVSGSYEEFGKYFWSLGGGNKPAGYQNIIYAVGVIAGAWAISQSFPSLVSQGLPEPSPALAALGGVIMVIGSRMAGGCTSGHGISGLSLLSTSSLVTIACTFIGAAAFAALPLAS